MTTVLQKKYDRGLVPFCALGPSSHSHRVSPVLFVILALLVSTTNLAFADGTIIDLGTLAGSYSGANAISADGLSVAGGSSVGGTHAFRWTSAGMEDLGVLPGSTYAEAYAISADGLFVAGRGILPGSVERAFLWTTNGGMQDLGTLGGNVTRAYGVSGDGSIVVGYGTFPLPNGTGQRAFRWTVSGMQQLPIILSQDIASHALAISTDGSTIVGDGQVLVPGVGIRPHAFRWTGAGVQDLGTIGVGGSYARAVNANGSVVVGYTSTAGSSQPYRAFRWTSAGMQDLGTLNTESYTTGATAVNADGSVVIGWGVGSNGVFQFLWTESLGMVDLVGYLSNRGVDLTEWDLHFPFGISADGLSITGSGYHNGVDRAYLIRLAPNCIGHTGDMNCDCVVDGRDIAPFAQAVLDPSAYAVAHPGCDILQGDMDANDTVELLDISGFVNCALTGTCP